MNTVEKQAVIDGVVVASVRGDITLEQVDAIVNAANSRLNHGGGVAAAISKAAGPSLQEESWKVAPVRTGSAAATPAGELPCRLVIHAVGPIWGGGSSREVELLRAAVLKALEIAAEEELNTVSFPSISAGIFGMPGKIAADTLVDAVIRFLADYPGSSLQQVRICNIDARMVTHVNSAISELTK